MLRALYGSSLSPRQGPKARLDQNGLCRALLSPVTWPISQVLDLLLGVEIGTVYSREELKHLIDIHVMDPNVQAESGLTSADQRLIVGALDYKNKRYDTLQTL